MLDCEGGAVRRLDTKGLVHDAEGAGADVVDVAVAGRRHDGETQQVLDDGPVGVGLVCGADAEGGGGGDEDDVVGAQAGAHVEGAERELVAAKDDAR